MAPRFLENFAPLQELNGTGSGLCPMVGSYSVNIDPLDSAYRRAEISVHVYVLFRI